MISFSYENIFDIHDADLRIVPVNIAGSMGAGLAKAFGTRYPDLLLEYVDACKKHRFRKTSSLLYRPDNGDPAILCVPTKIHWKHKSTREQVETSMKLIDRCMIANPSFEKVAMPALGCGLGEFPLHSCIDLAKQYFAKQDYFVKFLMHGMKPVMLELIDDLLITSIQEYPDTVEVDTIFRSHHAANFVQELFEKNELVGLTREHRDLFAFKDVSLSTTMEGTVYAEVKLYKVTHAEMPEGMYHVSS